MGIVVFGTVAVPSSAATVAVAPRKTTSATTTPPATRTLAGRRRLRRLLRLRGCHSTIPQLLLLTCACLIYIFCHCLAAAPAATTMMSPTRAVQLLAPLSVPVIEADRRHSVQAGSLASIFIGLMAAMAYEEPRAAVAIVVIPTRNGVAALQLLMCRSGDNITSYWW